MTNATATATRSIPSATAASFKNILVATDFSAASDQAVGYAASLARRYGSAIYLTHVTLDGYPLISPEYAAIEESIKMFDIDLVIVSTHGAGAVEKMLLGSGAEEISARPTFRFSPSARSRRKNPGTKWNSRTSCLPPTSPRARSVKPHTLSRSPKSIAPDSRSCTYFRIGKPTAKKQRSTWSTISTRNFENACLLPRKCTARSRCG
jgi:hypothetical protein